MTVVIPAYQALRTKNKDWDLHFETAKEIFWKAQEADLHIKYADLPKDFPSFNHLRSFLDAEVHIGEIPII